jgi:phosphocarrier protein HPr
MKSYEFELKNEHGLHARPAGLFVQECGKYQSAVALFKGELKVNGKSMLGLLKMAASKGDIIRIEVDGTDEETALKGLKALVDRGFDE